VTAFEQFPRRLTEYLTRSRLVLAIAVVAVLLARTAPPVFAHESFDYSSLSCAWDYHHRACFDHDGPARIVPSSTTTWLESPPKRLFLRPGFTDSLPLTRESEYQYNRPPPQRSDI
jgi:hypothetical protein